MKQSFLSMTDMFSQVRQKEPELLCHTTAYCRMSKPDTDSPLNVHVCPKISKCCLFTWRFLKITTALKFKTPLPLLQNHCKPFQRSAVECLHLWATPMSSEGTLPLFLAEWELPISGKPIPMGAAHTVRVQVQPSQKISSAFNPRTEETHGWSPIPQ